MEAEFSPCAVLGVPWLLLKADLVAAWTALKLVSVIVGTDLVWSECTACVVPV